MSELCKLCKTPMAVAKNKNGGYFATCPNKANHAGAKSPDAAPPKPDTPAPPAKAPTTRTVFGW